jgi:Tol biopolymer transport system component
VPVQIAFTQDAAHLAVLFQRIDSRQIAIYATANGERVWQTPTEQPRVSVPTWSPDSTQLAYYNEFGSALWLNTIRLANFTHDAIAVQTDQTVIPYQLSWSPDSAYILIHHTGDRNDSAPPSWSVIDLHKGTRAYLAGSTAFDIDPLWSPTGNYVALTRRYGSRFGARLYLLDKAGTANLLTPQQLLDLDVYWRPP